MVWSLRVKRIIWSYDVTAMITSLPSFFKFCYLWDWVSNWKSDHRWHLTGERVLHLQAQLSFPCDGLEECLNDRFQYTLAATNSQFGAATNSQFSDLFPIASDMEALTQPRWKLSTTWLGLKKLPQNKFRKQRTMTMLNLARVQRQLKAVLTWCRGCCHSSHSS